MGAMKRGRRPINMPPEPGKERDEAGEPPLPPIVRSLQGALHGAKVDEEDHRRHLEDKHR